MSPEVPERCCHGSDSILPITVPQAPLGMQASRAWFSIIKSIASVQRVCAVRGREAFKGHG